MVQVAKAFQSALYGCPNLMNKPIFSLGNSFILLLLSTMMFRIMATMGGPEEQRITMNHCLVRYLQQRISTCRGDSGYDCSIEETINIYLPAKWIVDNQAVRVGNQSTRCEFWCILSHSSAVWIGAAQPHRYMAGIR